MPPGHVEEMPAANPIAVGAQAKVVGAPPMIGVPANVAEILRRTQADKEAALEALQARRRAAWATEAARQAEDAQLMQAEAMQAQFQGFVAAQAQQAAKEQAEQALRETASGLSAKPKVFAKAYTAPPARTVYSSKPVLNTEAVKRPAEGEESADAPEAKRQAVQSPAEARAAAARAEGANDARVTWVMKGGKVLTKEEASAAAAAGEPSAAAVQSAIPDQSLAAQAPMLMPPPAGPPPGPPLPPGWVRVPHEGEYYYWNTVTQEVSWEHPSGPKAEPEKKEKPVFTEEHRILWSDLPRIIGRGGMNLKIINASIGCNVNVPRKGGKGKGGKGKDEKGKKGRGKHPDAIWGVGTGEKPIDDDQFVKVTVTADSKLAANGGKRCLEVMLGYGRTVERALEALGVEVKQPKLLDENTGGKGGNKRKDEIDPMDPSSYSDAPQGGWSAGMKKFGAQGQQTGGPAPEPRDSKTANAERF